MGNLYDELVNFDNLKKQLDAYVTRLEKAHDEKENVNDTPDIDSIAERNYENRKS